jgi:hypothetical protein
MLHYVAPPATSGLRVPVFFTPDRGDDLPPKLGAGGLDLEAARHSIVVILADRRMTRTVDGGTGQQWRDFMLEVVKKAPLNKSPHHVVPVALESGVRLADKLHVLPSPLMSGPKRAAEQQRLANVSLHIAARAIQLLAHGKVPRLERDRMKAPVQIFLSHAKTDLTKDRRDPVRLFRDAAHDLPIEQWYDESQIATSQDFAKAIAAGIRDCSIMLAFNTDHYSSRPWCRREVLDAKRLGAHILVVDALEAGEKRSFPYAGNVPVMRWDNSAPKLSARRIVDRAVMEALRFKHNLAVVQRSARRGVRVLAGAPEAVHLANAGSEAATFLYPDPPLGREELEVLQRLRPKAKFVTPLTLVAQAKRPKRIETIAVSISESDDLRHHGLSDHHLRTLTDEIHLYLLLAGLKIAYGGALKGNFAEASNFTLRLFELVQTYSKLAEGAHAKPLKHAILNIAPFPLAQTYTDKELDLFGDVARYEAAPVPRLPWAFGKLFPKGRISSDTPERRYAWARGLTAMRERITRRSQARLVIGGKLKGFSGLVPGVVEEAWFSMTHKQPLYLAGGFGGAARALCDLLLGGAREDLSGAWAKNNITDYEKSTAFYAQHGGEFRSAAAMCAEILRGSKRSVADALRNGLDDKENRELMLCTDAQRIAQLVLQGLRRI